MTKLTEQHIEMETYTVYRHTNPINNEVFYIGKGTEKHNRRTQFWNKKNKYYLEILKSITDANLTPVVDVLNTTTEEDTAYYLEQMWISWYGRKDLNTGTLVNLTDGGAGALNPSQGTRNRLSEVHKGNTYHVGRSCSDETKLKMSEAQTGRHHNESTKIKMSDSSKKYWSVPKNKMARSGKNGSMYGVSRLGEDSPMYGKKHSDEAKRKMSESAKGRKHTDETLKKMSIAHSNVSDETRRKISESLKGRVGCMKGKKHSEETKLKISKAHKGRVVSDETRLRMSEARKEYHANRKLQAS